jgi:hypothetical protein
MPEECLRIDRSRRSSHSLPVETQVETADWAGGFQLPDNFAERTNPIRGRLIVIAFVAATPIAIGAWLWLLGRVALALL